ncbi:MAG: hypothetical protein CL936_06805 [Deltaproteobacteria bacterium]|nr:hypothetical protein [Deltaproteobacteria bacterium]
MWQKKLRILRPAPTRSRFVPGRGGRTGCPGHPQRGQGEKHRSFFVFESCSGPLELFLKQLIGKSREAFTEILEKSARDVLAAPSGTPGDWRFTHGGRAFRWISGGGRGGLRILRPR